MLLVEKEAEDKVAGLGRGRRWRRSRRRRRRRGEGGRSDLF
jgi:hypothetical protein